MALTRTSVYCVAWSPDGTLLASASKDGAVKIWDVANRKELKSLIIKDSKDATLQVAFAGDNKTLYACGLDKYLHVWDATAGLEVKKLGPMPDSLFGLAVSKDGSAVATACYDGHLRLWDVATGASKAFQLRDGKKRTLITYCIALTSDGSAVLTGHEADKAVRVTPIDRFVITADARR